VETLKLKNADGRSTIGDKRSCITIYNEKGEIKMAENEGVIQAADFKDRKTRLVVFGILQIIFGGLCALVVPLMVLCIVMSATMKKGDAGGFSLRMMIPGILVYVLLAVWFICMGIGSIGTKRWARALTLVSSWLWLITGTLGFIFVLSFLSAMYGKMGEAGQVPKTAAVIMKYMMMAFLAVFYIIIPGLLVLFYSGKDIKATCEYRDPHIRWTDRCPLPVLAMSVMCAVWAASLLFITGAYGWVIPFFGVILSGLPGAIAACVLILLLIYIARGLYKLDIKAWWCILIVNIGWALSAMITFSLVSMQTFYEKMHFPEQQLEKMNQLGTHWEYFMKYSSVFWVIAVLAYLLYIRRYFTDASSQTSASR
jgi:hypothetical protein